MDGYGESVPQDIISLLKICLSDADDPITYSTILPALGKYTTCAPSLATIFQGYGTEDVLMDFVLHEDSLTTLQSILSILGLLDLQLPPNSAIATSAAATATSSPQAAMLFRALVVILSRIFIEIWILLQERDLEIFLFSATSLSNATNSNYETRADVLRRREDFLEIIYEFFKLIALRWMGKPISADIAPQYVRLTPLTYETFTPSLVTLLYLCANSSAYSGLQAYSDALLATHAQASSSSTLTQQHQQSIEQFRSVHLCSLLQVAVLDVLLADWPLFVERCRTQSHFAFFRSLTAPSSSILCPGYVYANAQVMLLVLQLLLNHRLHPTDPSSTSIWIPKKDDSFRGGVGAVASQPLLLAFADPQLRRSHLSSVGIDIDDSAQRVSVLALVEDFVGDFVLAQLLHRSPLTTSGAPTQTSMLFERLRLLRDVLCLCQHRLCAALRPRFLHSVAHALVQLLEHYEEETMQAAVSSYYGFATDYDSLITWLLFCLRDVPVDFTADPSPSSSSSRQGIGGKRAVRVSIWYRAWECVFLLRQRMCLEGSFADVGGEEGDDENGDSKDEGDENSMRSFLLFGGAGSTSAATTNTAAAASAPRGGVSRDERLLQKSAMAIFVRLVSEFALLVCRSGQDVATGRWLSLPGVTDACLRIEDMQCRAASASYAHSSSLSSSTSLGGAGDGASGHGHGEDGGDADGAYQGSSLQCLVREMLRQHLLHYRTASDVSSEFVLATFLTTSHATLQQMTHALSQAMVRHPHLHHFLSSSSSSFSSSSASTAPPVDLLSAEEEEEEEDTASHHNTHSHDHHHQQQQQQHRKRTVDWQQPDVGYSDDMRLVLETLIHICWCKSITPPSMAPPSRPSVPSKKHPPPPVLTSYAEISSRQFHRWEAFHRPMLPVMQLVSLLHLTPAQWHDVLAEYAAHCEASNETPPSGADNPPRLPPPEELPPIQDLQVIIFRLVVDVYLAQVEDALYLLDTVSL